MSPSELGRERARDAAGRELREDMTVTELVRLAIALDVPAADLLAELQRRQDDGIDG